MAVSNQLLLQYIIQAQNQAAAVLAENAQQLGTLTSALGKVSDQAEKATNSLTPTVDVLNTLRSAYNETVGEIVNFAKESTQMAAQAEMLGTALTVAGRNAGYTKDALDSSEKAIKSLGIATIEARQTMTLFIQSQLDLKDASKLARAAQDLAVNAQMNSSTATQTLTEAIGNQSVMMLRQFGLVTTSDQIFNKYKMTHKEVTGALDETQKKQAFLNAVLEFGARSAGTYVAAMQDVGKQQASLKRYTDEAMVAFGQGFLPILQKTVSWTQYLAEAFTHSTPEFKRFVTVVVTLIGTFGTLITTITSVRLSWVALTKVFDVLGGGLSKMNLAILGVTIALSAMAAAYVYWQSLQPGKKEQDLAEGYDAQAKALEGVKTQLEATAQAGKSEEDQLKAINAARLELSKILKTTIPEFKSMAEITDYAAAAAGGLLKLQQASAQEAMKVGVFGGKTYEEAVPAIEAQKKALEDLDATIAKTLKGRQDTDTMQQVAALHSQREALVAVLKKQQESIGTYGLYTKASEEAGKMTAAEVKAIRDKNAEQELLTTITGKAAVTQKQMDQALGDLTKRYKLLVKEGVSTAQIGQILGADAQKLKDAYILAGTKGIDPLVNKLTAYNQTAEVTLSHSKEWQQALVAMNKTVYDHAKGIQTTTNQFKLWQTEVALAQKMGLSYAQAIELTSGQIDELSKKLDLTTAELNELMVAMRQRAQTKALLELRQQTIDFTLSMENAGQEAKTAFKVIEDSLKDLPPIFMMSTAQLETLKTKLEAAMNQSGLTADQLDKLRQDLAAVNAQLDKGITSTTAWAQAVDAAYEQIRKAGTDTQQSFEKQLDVFDRLTKQMGDIDKWPIGSVKAMYEAFSQLKEKSDELTDDSLVSLNALLDALAPRIGKVTANLQALAITQNAAASATGNANTALRQYTEMFDHYEQATQDVKVTTLELAKAQVEWTKLGKSSLQQQIIDIKANAAERIRLLQETIGKEIVAYSKLGDEQKKQNKEIHDASVANNKLLIEEARITAGAQMLVAKGATNAQILEYKRLGEAAVAAFLESGAASDEYKAALQRLDGFLTTTLNKAIVSLQQMGTIAGAVFQAFSGVGSDSFKEMVGLVNDLWGAFQQLAQAQEAVKMATVGSEEAMKAAADEAAAYISMIGFVIKMVMKYQSEQASWAALVRTNDASRRTIEDFKSLGAASEDLRKKIADLTDAYKAWGYSMSVAMAEAMSLQDIIKELGGWSKLTQEQITVVQDHMLLLFDFITKEGPRAWAEIEQLDATLAQMGEDTKKQGGLVSKFFLDMVKNAQAAGIELGKVNDFLKGELSNAATGLNKIFTGLQASATASAQAMARKAGPKEGESDADFEKRIKDIRGQVQMTQDAFNGMSAAVSGNFFEMINKGATFSEALAANKDAIEGLRQAAIDSGLDPSWSKPYQLMSDMAAIASDEITGPLADSIAGTTEALQGLHNAGILNQDMFSGLTQTATDAYKQILAQGKDGTAALALMQPELQTVWELQKDFGYQVDDTTQAMLDQAEAAGVVGAKHQSVQKQMLDATESIQKAVEALARVFGVDIPIAADKMGTSLQKTASDSAESFKKFQGTSTTASDKTTDGVDHVNTAVDDVNSQLKISEDAFKRWADVAAEAAGKVKDSVDAVSFGSSPGGIKEIPIQLAKSNAAAKQFEQVFTDSMDSAKDAVPAVTVTPGMTAPPIVNTGVAGPNGGIIAPMPNPPPWWNGGQPPDGGLTLTLNFNVTTLNADGLKEAVEQDIVPLIVDTIRANRRQARSNFRSTLGVKG